MKIVAIVLASAAAFVISTAILSAFPELSPHRNYVLLGCGLLAGRASKVN